MSGSDGPQCLEVYHRSRARLAVALAVLKSRPAGRSGRKHAECLSARVQEQERTWRTKAEELQNEVLTLKQDLLLQKLQSKRRPGAETTRGDDVVNLFSQEAKLSEIDSGSNTQTLSLTPFPADAACSSTVVPPSSLQPSQVSFHIDSRDSALSKHMRFLQNLCVLRKSAKSPHMDGGDAVLEDTALTMIESLVQAHREAGEGRSGDAAHLDSYIQASRLVAQVLEREVGRRKRTLEKAEELLEELLEVLLNNSQLNKFAVQDNLTQCLICLGGASVLRPVVVHLVLTRIIHLAEHLWSICQEVPERQHPQQVDWVRYENSFYLFWILEQLFQASSCSTGSEHHRHQLSQFEKLIYPLSDEFPLFALYMWRIKGFLNPASTPGT